MEGISDLKNRFNYNVDHSRRIVYGFFSVGMTIEEIKQIRKYIPMNHLEAMRTEFVTLSQVGVSLGNKNQPYFTEDEMLHGFRVDASSLKGWELEQFNK